MSRMSELDMERQTIASLAAGDIGQLAYDLREGAREAFNRRAELGDAELKDIVEAAALLASTLQQIDRQREAARAA